MQGMTTAVNGRKITAPKFNLDDTVTVRKHREAMEAVCHRLASAIVRTGKLHGPTDVKGLFEYLNNSRVQYFPRKEAMEAGNPYYFGMPCKSCGEPLRYTKGSGCVNCDPHYQRQRKKEENVKAAMAEAEKIAIENGFDMETLRGRQIKDGVGKLRHKIWKFLAHQGVSLAEIGRQFGDRDHSTIRMALYGKKPRPA